MKKFVCGNWSAEFFPAEPYYSALKTDGNSEISVDTWFPGQWKEWLKVRDIFRLEVGSSPVFYADISRLVDEGFVTLPEGWQKVVFFDERTPIEDRVRYIREKSRWGTYPTCKWMHSFAPHFVASWYSCISRFNFPDWIFGKHDEYLARIAPILTVLDQTAQTGRTDWEVLYHIGLNEIKRDTYESTNLSQAKSWLRDIAFLAGVSTEGDAEPNFHDAALCVYDGKNFLPFYRDSLLQSESTWFTTSIAWFDMRNCYILVNAAVIRKMKDILQYIHGFDLGQVQVEGELFHLGIIGTIGKDNARIVVEQIEKRGKDNAQYDEVQFLKAWERCKNDPDFPDNALEKIDEVELQYYMNKYPSLLPVREARSYDN